MLHVNVTTQQNMAPVNGKLSVGLWRVGYLMRNCGAADGLVSDEEVLICGRLGIRLRGAELWTVECSMGRCGGCIYTKSSGLRIESLPLCFGIDLDLPTR
jgi:hypothetical protein